MNISILARGDNHSLLEEMLWLVARPFLVSYTSFSDYDYPFLTKQIVIEPHTLSWVI